MVRSPVKGRVINQDLIMPRTTRTFKADMPRASATPMTAPTRVWVVEIGNPRREQMSTVGAAANSAALTPNMEDDKMNHIDAINALGGRKLAEGKATLHGGVHMKSTTKITAADTAGVDPRLPLGGERRDFILK